jgi:aryl-alcohol dehydrogenase-like predicted oxidoreductase
MIEGRATAEGTDGFAQRSAAASGHFRATPDGLRLSSIGLGTYLGDEDDATDAGFEESVAIALACGINVFDTAINYRGQRSERAIGRAIARAASSGLAARSEIFVSSKGGFVPRDAPPPPDLVAGCHSLSPAFLARSLDQSRENLGLSTIDLYYLHNPETQLQGIPASDLPGRIRGAVEMLERSVSDGTIALWGLATWEGLRAPPNHPAHLSLEDTLSIAREIAGDGHHFAAVQAPLNIAMLQALGFPSQRLNGSLVPLVQAAFELGLLFFSSASLLQGRLAVSDLPPEVDELFPEVPEGAQRALQMPRSSPGVTCALVGVSNPEHARDTFGLAHLAPAASEKILALLR